MKLFKITSKKTGHSEIIDQDVKDMLTKEDLKKYFIEALPEQKKVIPEEIVKKVTKGKTDND